MKMMNDPFSSSVRGADVNVELKQKDFGSKIEYQHSHRWGLIVELLSNVVDEF